MCASARPGIAVRADAVMLARGGEVEFLQRSQMAAGDADMLDDLADVGPADAA